MIEYILSMILLALGFGFVVFWHELGHFLAAKWVGIKVEQFAVGFGQAIVSWRKGLGFRFGSSAKEYDELVRAGQGANVGETEYRWNWMPLGGYVKMLGQDDLRPNATNEDPRAYNKKSVGARMFVVSAGVIMNIILAAIGFMVVFLMGYEVPVSVVGNVSPGSPAAAATRLVDGQLKPAPLQVGDRILQFDGKVQHDFTKIMLSMALAEEGVPVPILVQRVDGTREELQVAPKRPTDDPQAFVALGIEGPHRLAAMDDKEYKQVLSSEVTPQMVPAETLLLQPGDVIVAVNERPVSPTDLHVFDEALQASAGKPVQVSIRGKTGEVREAEIQPLFLEPFGTAPLNFLGMLPRTAVASVFPQSPALGKILPDDVIVKIEPAGGQAIANPSARVLTDTLSAAGEAEKPVKITVERDGELVALPEIVPGVRLPNGRYGMSITLRSDGSGAVVTEVLDSTPAAKAGIPAGATITSVNGEPVKSWFDVRAQLMRASAGEAVTLTAQTLDDETKTFELTLDDKEAQAIAGLRYWHAMLLGNYDEPRKTDNPLVAAWWGATETRDFVLQFYLTLQRMFQGSVSYKNMMGPVGIFNAGTKFAIKGTDWLIWFLAMISANLAVVNFLPIPIVDGGLFLFLIIEKIQGRPLSPKTQSIAQVVGLALLLSVFLLVTYQDIARLLTAV